VTFLVLGLSDHRGLRGRFAHPFIVRQFKCVMKKVLSHKRLRHECLELLGRPRNSFLPDSRLLVFKRPLEIKTNV
jgi:hypothetical protein